MAEMNQYKASLDRLQNLDILKVGVQSVMEKELEDVRAFCLKEVESMFKRAIKDAVHEAVLEIRCNYMPDSNRQDFQVTVKELEKD